jgi:hypothetical protein
MKPHRLCRHFARPALGLALIAFAGAPAFSSTRAEIQTPCLATVLDQTAQARISVAESGSRFASSILGQTWDKLTFKSGPLRGAKKVTTRVGGFLGQGGFGTVMKGTIQFEDGHTRQAAIKVVRREETKPTPKNRGSLLNKVAQYAGLKTERPPVDFMRPAARDHEHTLLSEERGFKLQVRAAAPAFVDPQVGNRVVEPLGQIPYSDPKTGKAQAFAYALAGKSVFSEKHLYRLPEAGDAVQARRNLLNIGRLARDLLDALAQLRRAGVVHRDIKEGNVVIDTQGHLLIDFGNGVEAGARLDRKTQITGTIGTIAPENWGPDPARLLSDLYSTSAMMVRLLTDIDLSVDHVHRQATGHPASVYLDAAAVAPTLDTRRKTLVQQGLSPDDLRLFDDLAEHRHPRRRRRRSAWSDGFTEGPRRRRRAPIDDSGSATQNA